MIFLSLLKTAVCLKEAGFDIFSYIKILPTFSNIIASKKSQIWLIRALLNQKKLLKFEICHQKFEKAENSNFAHTTKISLFQIFSGKLQVLVVFINY